MLEIIALVYLTGQIGQLAAQKGLKKGRWKLHTVLLWFGGEIAGIIICTLLFGPDNLILVLLLAYACAIGTYFILRSNLATRPDAVPEPFDFENGST
jgi:uncharacterized membrane protein YfcA